MFTLLCLPYNETVNQKRTFISLRAKEKVNNAKCLGLLGIWIFFLIDKAVDRPFSNTEANYLPGVKENVSFGCSGFSQCNKSQPEIPVSFSLIKIFFKKRKSLLFLLRTVVSIS